MYNVKPHEDVYGVYKNEAFLFVMHNLKYANEVCDMLNYDEKRYSESIDIKD